MNDPLDADANPGRQRPAIWSSSSLAMWIASITHISSTGVGITSGPTGCGSWPAGCRSVTS